MSGDSPRAQDDINLNNVHFVSLIERSIHYQNSTSSRFDASIIGVHVHFFALSIFLVNSYFFDMAPFTAFITSCLIVASGLFLTIVFQSPSDKLISFSIEHKKTVGKAWYF